MSLCGAVKGHAQPVHQVDDDRGLVAHVADQGLMREEIPALDGIVEMDFRRIALPLGVNGGIDSPLRADGVRPFDGLVRDEDHIRLVFAELHGGGQPRQPAPDHDYFLFTLCHHSFPEMVGSTDKGLTENSNTVANPINVSPSPNRKNNTLALRWAWGPMMMPQETQNPHRPLAK